MVGLVPDTHSREALNGSTRMPEERPRLLRLGALLTEWQADAEAAHLAYTTGTPRGPITSLPSLDRELGGALAPGVHVLHAGDRKSTRLNSSHSQISYAVFCLKKKKK